MNYTYKRLFGTYVENSIQHAFGITLDITLEEKFLTGVKLLDLEEKIDKLTVKVSQNEAETKYNSSVINKLEKK